MSGDEKTPEEKALDRVLEVIDRYLEAYHAANRIRVLELLMANKPGLVDILGYEGMAEKAEGLYAKLVRRSAAE